jgi:hypothetical protein
VIKNEGDFADISQIRLAKRNIQTILQLFCGKFLQPDSRLKRIQRKVGAKGEFFAPLRLLHDFFIISM